MTLRTRSKSIWQGRLLSLVAIGILAVAPSCGVAVNYSMSGKSTTAKTISITEFYNNTDLGQANIGQTFTNQLKNYLIQNSDLKVIQEEGELLLEGEVSGFTVTPIAPVANNASSNGLTQASSTRLTITVKVTYVNSLDETMSFTDKSFSFYKDFTNDQNLTDVQEQYTRQIFDRIVNDIFNASVANW